MSNDEIQIETKGGAILIRMKWMWAIGAVAALQGMLLTGLYLALDRHNDERYVPRLEYLTDQKYFASERANDQRANEKALVELKSSISEINRNIITLMGRK